MNKQDYDIMNAIVKSPYLNQRELANRSGYSVGKVNSSLKVLLNHQYIDEDMHLTANAWKELREKKPKNAVILAAGYGMRMIPINAEVPKGLLEVQGEPLIERVIRQLHEADVKEIHIVVGFMKEQYEYLIDKYDVNLVFNRDYSTKNNLYSLQCVADKIGNTYIVPCDIWCKDNPFSQHEWYSWYMVTDQESEESTVRVSRKKELVNIRKDETGNAMIGISYLIAEDAFVLRKTVKEYTLRKEYNHAFWEQALFNEKGLAVGAKMVESTNVYEINTYEQLRELDDGSDQLKSDVLQLIADILKCDVDEIGNIIALKKGMTNRSFRFEVRGQQYIMRIPGEGTDKMINRKNEWLVYKCLKGRKITDPVVYISPDNGYKITRYIPNVRVCDSNNPEEVAKCMCCLKKFHNLNIQVDHSFDLYERIEYYEELRGNVPSMYRDYASTKEKMYELKKFIDEQPKQISLTHIDAVCDNFLITDEKIYLIDWEYAGMQDVHVDIAMFAVYSMYGREKVDELIVHYFRGEPDYNVKTKIYCYIAICGFVWSNWCEYKRICGVEFGEYSLRQYRFAKEYYAIAKERMGHE
ncbi:NTP transferase domain-containing protein [Sporofaciens musculi]|jgi:CTP:phosphocholine cytidylyltransferase-like protein/thiamine kinase-like enzyme|uniref:NTP transferase domain-containing protein n=1 Tax=Sporofaciens musculi TaxID=2681861 RepID=UPI0025A03E6D|nr:NTP transferase domain-containing protein [Sporofaciens musculi]